MVYNPAFTIAKSASVADGTADKAGDVINCTIPHTSSGNDWLTDVCASDKVEAYAGTSVSGPASGDGNSNGILDVGETWVYKTNYTRTHAYIESNDDDGIGTLDNKTTATTNEGGSHSATASVPLVYNPAFTISKVSAVADGTADSAGDVINYTITGKTTANIFPYTTLFRSKVEAYAGTSVSGPASGDGNSNGILDVGETWVYKT